MMYLEELAAQIPGVNFEGNPKLEIHGICYDSRQAKKGDLFVAIRGTKTDGTHFLMDAARRGAVAVASDGPFQTDSPCALLKVEDARQFLANAARVFFRDPATKLKLVAITGTNGKTTISYILDSIFRHVGLKSCMVGTTGMKIGERPFPSDLTTPEAPDLMRFLSEALNSGCTHGVLEVSSHALIMKRALGTKFAVAVFSNLTPEHLDFHEDMEAYYQAKRLLFSPEGQNQIDIAVINIDDPYGRRLLSEIHRPILRYGLKPGADIRLLGSRMHFDRTEIRASTPQGEVSLVTYLVGSANIYNVLASIGAALCLDIDLGSICHGIELLKRVPGRLELIGGGQPFRVFVDYAHTPDALQKLLESITELPHGRLITVFGCGGERDRKKRPAMGEIAARLSDFVIATSDNPRTEDPMQILLEIEPGLTRGPARYMLVLDRREAISMALSMAREGDVIAIAGKGHEDYQLIGNRSFPFDDRVVAQELIAQLPKS